MSNLELWSRVQGNCETYAHALRKPEPMPYKTDVLLDAAEEYVNAENEHRSIARMVAGRSMEPVEHQRYWDSYKDSTAAYDKLRSICQVVGADPDSVLAISKAFRRYSQYRRGWDFVATWHMGHRECVAFRRAVQSSPT